MTLQYEYQISYLVGTKIYTKFHPFHKFFDPIIFCDEFILWLSVIFKL